MARVFLFTCVLHRAWQKQKLQEPTLFTFSIFRQLCISLLRLKYFTLYTFVLYPVFFVVNWFSNVLYSFEFLTFPKTVNSEHKHFFGGLIHGGRGLIIRNHFCVWSSSHLLQLYLNKVEWNKTKKTRFLQQSAIFLRDSKQKTWCFSQFRTITFIKDIKNPYARQFFNQNKQ